MLDPELLERITVRRAELDELEEQLTKQLAEVQAERDELAVAERVLERVSDQLANERASTSSPCLMRQGRCEDLGPESRRLSTLRLANREFSGPWPGGPSGRLRRSPGR